MWAMRALGVVWLIATLAFVLLAGAVLAGWNVRPDIRDGRVVDCAVRRRMAGGAHRAHCKCRSAGHAARDAQISPCANLPTTLGSIRNAPYTRPHVYYLTTVTGGQCHDGIELELGELWNLRA